MLRNQHRSYPGFPTEVPLPVRGINLRNPPHKLEEGEAVCLCNVYFDGGVLPIPGTTLLTSSALASPASGRGGYRCYWATAGRPSVRLVAYGQRISTISDLGAETILTSGMTNDLDTFFNVWSITDKCYISNGTDVVRTYDGSSFVTLSGTAIPAAQGQVVPVLDRLFAIVGNKIEHTNPRVDNVWSTNSSWATFRPVKPGNFTALAPFSLREGGSVFPGALAFQDTAFYLITGTDYGADVTAASPSTTFNGSIQLMDPTIGTSSPRSVCTVPGVGVFWVTSDLNVYFLPDGSMNGLYVGDDLIGKWQVEGFDKANLAAISQIQLEYFDRKLILRYPHGSSTFNNMEFWLDLRYALSGQSKEFVWYGPHDANSIGVLWREGQKGELTLKGIEGNPTVGVYVYNAFQMSTVGHTIGSTTNLPTITWQTPYRSRTDGQTLEYIQRARITSHVVGPLPQIGLTELNSGTALVGTVTKYAS